MKAPEQLAREIHGLEESESYRNQLERLKVEGTVALIKRDRAETLREAANWIDKNYITMVGGVDAPEEPASCCDDALCGAVRKLFDMAAELEE